MRNIWIVLALIVCVFGNTTGEFVIAGILPAIADDLRISISDAGLLVTAYAIGMIVGGPLLTSLTVRFSRKPLIVWLLAVSVIGNLVSAVAPNYPALFAARMITSLVTATFFANAIVIAASTAPAGKQASAVSMLAFGMNLSMILGAPIGTFIGTHAGWRATFMAIALCGAVGWLLVIRLVPNLPRESSRTSVWTEWRVFRSPDVLIAIAVTAIGNAGQLAVFTYLSPLLTSISGFSEESVALLLLAYGVGATIGNFIGGRLSDRAPMTSQVSLLASLAACLLLFGLFASDAFVAAVLVFLMGALCFSVIPGMQTRVFATARSAPTLAIAVNASAYQLAAALAAWWGGAVIHGGFGLRSIYFVGACVTTAGIILSSYAWLRDRQTLRTSEPSGSR
ncbi:MULTISPECIES: MFS transporter [unclassified Paenibacillus]|uniref:MFS transporter n=1 Tax=unclassified Paenibacillus TaxID=185978 RepID=UPI001C1056F8|nr:MULTISPECIES: MFS transporter [unclassified Paenibacillus]MBU5441888.1 MFS transporter [Paenibacillus sp. MSJ-34]CAH0122619.1 Inner membrane transport protein YdhP [Paenibacillus sp. CECT 9249]